MTNLNFDVPKTLKLEDFNPNNYAKPYDENPEESYLPYDVQRWWFEQLYPNGRIVTTEPTQDAEHTPGAYVSTAMIWKDKNDAIEDIKISAKATLSESSTVDPYQDCQRKAISLALKTIGLWITPSKEVKKPSVNPDDVGIVPDEKPAEIKGEENPAPKKERKQRMTKAEKLEKEAAEKEAAKKEAAEKEVTTSETESTEKLTDESSKETVTTDSAEETSTNESENETVTDDASEETTEESTKETALNNTDEPSTEESTEEAVTEPPVEEKVVTEPDEKTTIDTETVGEELMPLDQARAVVVNYRTFENMTMGEISDCDDDKNQKFIEWLATSPRALAKYPNEVKAAKAICASKE